MGYSVERAVLSKDLSHFLRALCFSGPRNTSYQISRSRRLLEAELEAYGYILSLQPVETPGDKCRYNLIARNKVPGRRYLLTAHYDTVPGTVGADDNASGVVSVLSIARLLSDSNIPLEFVFFTNEEPPYFMTKSMGSRVFFDYLEKTGKLKNYGQVINLDCVGYYSSHEHKDRGGMRGDEVGILVSKSDSQSLKLFFSWSPLSQTKMVPVALSKGDFLGQMSDQAHVFEKMPAVQVMDMALTRNLLMHTPEDTPETLNYDRMADVVIGVTDIIIKGWERNGNGRGKDQE